MTQEPRFVAALKSLQDWHTDSLKARDYNSPGVSSGKPAARMLRAQEYPSTRTALDRWRGARSDLEREEIIEDLEAEFYGLGVGPSRKYEEHPGTVPLRRAIATAGGSLRHVARQFGVSHTTVSRYRKEFPCPK